MSNQSSSPEHNQTVQKILTEAQHLFAQRGFDGVSINDVATAAGVSKSNVFHHFGTKPSLYLEVLKSSLDRFNAMTDHLEPDRAPIEKRLYRFLEANAAHLQQYPESALLVLRELLENRQEVTQHLAEQVTDAQFKQLFALLQEAQKAGEIRAEVDLAALVLMMIGSVVFQFQVRSLIQHHPEVGFDGDPAEYSRLLVDILLNGIRKKGTEK